MKSLYKVEEGEVSHVDLADYRADESEDVGTNYVYALAEDEADALDLAKMYEAGKVGLDNRNYSGEIVVALERPQERE